MALSLSKSSESQPSWGELAQLLSILFVYSFLGFRMALAKPFWNDELFTLYVARADSWRGIWDALATGADQLSPMLHVFIRLAENVFGNPHLAARIPSLLGFGGFLLFLWLFLRPRYGALWATLATTFAMTTGAVEYAVEARGYALLLGSSAMALWAWASSCRYPRSHIYPFLLTIALALGVSSHYYGVFCWVPIALGELVFFAGNGVRFRIVVAQTLALFPLALLWPLIRQAEDYRHHFWASARPADLLLFPGDLLGPSLAVVVLGACAVTLLARRDPVALPTKTGGGLPLHERVAVLSFAAIPFMVMTLAVLFTDAYTDRYFIIALIGWIIVLVDVGARLQLDARLVAFLAASFLVFAMLQATQASRFWRHQQALLQPRFVALANACPVAPLIFNDHGLFLLSGFYGGKELESRRFIVADVEQSIRFIGHDTQNRGALDLRQVFPEGILTLHEFDALDRDACVVGEATVLTWFEKYLLERNRSLELLSLVDGIPVYLLSNQSSTQALASGNPETPIRQR
jgi:hypothetical protein